MSQVKKYRATARGYNGVKVVEVGEVFDFAGTPGKWMELVGGKPEAPKAPEVPPTGKVAKGGKPEAPKA